MAARTLRDPSPVRSAFTHSALGLTAFVATFGAAAAGVTVLGNAEAASPSVRVALFDTNDIDALELRDGRAVEWASRTLVDVPTLPTTSAPVKTGDLGVEYSNVAAPAQARPAPSQGIRINGRMVQPGQSLSSVQASANAVSVLTPQTAVATLADTPKPVPAAPEQPTTVFERYSRPFENPDSKPTVSIVLGGLGINRRQTAAAINELPPEVTLSFAPTAKGLQSWINQARKAGHEVLIEVPMEPYEYGRLRPHPQIIQAGVSPQTNAARFDKLLSRVRGYMGVTNYQGDKFATDAEAVAHFVKLVDDRGLALIEDGSLSRSQFAVAADTSSIVFGKAAAVLDTRPEADEIESNLLLLEAEARQNGSSLGSGFAFPVTIDLINDWTEGLEAKGILLAPASYHARRSQKAGQVDVAALDRAG